MTARTFRLGGDLEVNRLGFGAMRLTGQPGNFGPYPDWQGGLALLRRARALGVDFFDSAWAYGPEQADRLLGEALEGQPALLATKGGVDKPEAGRIVVDGSRETLLRQIDRALVNLRRPRIDLFQLHRVDPETPLEVSVAALAEAQADGRIGHIGLSNVTREELTRALAVAPVASVQNRFNSAERAAEDLVDFTAARGIAFIPYGPLGAHPLRPGAALPAREALAWLLRRSPNILVIPGTTNPAHLEENWQAWAEVERLDREAAD
ncbi:MAG: aldo/keto reductase [Rhodospirillales bacterium]